MKSSSALMNTLVYDLGFPLIIITILAGAISWVCRSTKKLTKTDVIPSEH